MPSTSCQWQVRPSRSSGETLFVMLGFVQLIVASCVIVAACEPVCDFVAAGHGALAVRTCALHCC